MKKIFLLTISGFAALLFAAPAIASEVELHLVVDCMPGQKQFAPIFSDRKPICIAPSVIADDRDIVFAKPYSSKYSGGQVLLTLDEAAKKRLAEVTENNVMRQIAVLSEGKLVAAAVIFEPIRGGELVINAPDDVANRLLKIFQDRTLVK